MAATLRVVHDNAALTATVTASSTAGSLVAANLQSYLKSIPWRSTGTSSTLTLTWATTKAVACVVLPFSNLSSTATFRARCYTNVGDANPVLDTGVQLAAAGYTDVPAGVNSFAYGGGAYGSIWFAPTSCKKVVLDIVDTSNPLGYVEASAIVAGNYWTTAENAEYGAELSYQDRTTNTRSDAGDLRSDRGTMSKVLSFSMDFMSLAERNSFWAIMKKGTSTPIYVSLIPQADDAVDEQMHQVYGKLSSASKVKYTFMNQFGSSIDIEEL
jgi:hypothetical protein